MPSTQFYTFVTLSALGVLFTAATMITYQAFAKLRKFPSNLVACMAACQFVGCVARTLSAGFGDETRAITRGALCTVQGALVNAGDLGGYSYNFCIIVNLVVCLKYNPAAEQVRSLSRAYHWFVGTLCVVLTGILLALDEFAPVEVYWYES